MKLSGLRLNCRPCASALACPRYQRLPFKLLVMIRAWLHGQAGGMDAVTDLGGSILTGIDGNQLAVLARQLRIPLYDINSGSVPLYAHDGSEVDGGVDNKVCASMIVLHGICNRHAASGSQEAAQWQEGRITVPSARIRSMTGLWLCHSDHMAVQSLS